MSHIGKPNIANEGMFWDGYKFANSLINNAKIDPVATIAGTKVSPDFGSQNLITLGDGYLGHNLRFQYINPFSGSNTIQPYDALAGEGSGSYLIIAASSAAPDSISGDFGGQLFLQAGHGGLAGRGGNASIAAGDGSATSVGGSVNIYAGGNNSGALAAAGGGSVNIWGGDSSDGGTGPGGNIQLTGGASGTVIGGNIIIQGGTGATNGGYTSIIGGTGTLLGGNLTLQGGFGLTTGGGGVTYLLGADSGIGGTPGTLIISGGKNATTPTPTFGQIYIGTYGPTLNTSFINLDSKFEIDIGAGKTPIVYLGDAFSNTIGIHTIDLPVNTGIFQIGCATTSFVAPGGTGNYTIKVDDETVGNVVGGGLTIKAGAGHAIGNGGALALTAGASGLTSGRTGGAVTITAGVGSSTGGAININAGTGGSNNGSINIGSTTARNISIGAAAVGVVSMGNFSYGTVSISSTAFSLNATANTMNLQYANADKLVIDANNITVQASTTLTTTSTGRITIPNGTSLQGYKLDGVTPVGLISVDSSNQMNLSDLSVPVVFMQGVNPFYCWNGTYVTLNVDSSGNTTAAGYAQIGGSTGPTWTSHTGTPEAAVTAPVGSIVSRIDGAANSSLYIKESGAGNTGWTAVRAAGGSYVKTFTYADLVAGALTVNHGLVSQYPIVEVYDGYGSLVVPNSVTATSSIISTIDLSGFGAIYGTWHAVVVSSGTATGAFVKAFTNTDVVGNILTVAHNLNNEYNTVQVYRNDGYVMIPDNIKAVSANSLEIHLQSAVPITGTWFAVVGGALGSTGGGGISAIVSVAVGQSPYAVSSTDRYISIDPSGGAITINLPASPGTVQQIMLKNRTTSTTAITINRAGSQTIDGATSITMNTSRAAVTLTYNASTADWEIS